MSQLTWVVRRLLGFLFKTAVRATPNPHFYERPEYTADLRLVEEPRRPIWWRHTRQGAQVSALYIRAIDAGGKKAAWRPSSCSLIRMVASAIASGVSCSG